MDKITLVALLGDLETKAIRWSTKSYLCGAHDVEETRIEMKHADSEFSYALRDLREAIISEGVTE